MTVGDALITVLGYRTGYEAGASTQPSQFVADSKRPELGAAMTEGGKILSDGRPVELTPEELGRIRRTQWYCVLAGMGGSIAFFVIMTWFGPFETGPLFAILAVIATPAAVSYVAFRRTAVRILRQAALRRDLG